MFIMNLTLCPSLFFISAIGHIFKEILASLLLQASLAPATETQQWKYAVDSVYFKLPGDPENN